MKGVAVHTMLRACAWGMILVHAPGGCGQCILFSFLGSGRARVQSLTVVHFVGPDQIFRYPILWCYDVVMHRGVSSLGGQLSFS